MLNNFRNLQSLYRSLGPRWLIFRAGYALRMKMGFIRRQIPAYDWKERPLGTWLKKEIPSQTDTYARWRRQNSPVFFFREARLPGHVSWNPDEAVKQAERALHGELEYFGHNFVRTGFPPDWHKDPFSGKRLDSARHWSELSNDGEVDIKFIWEASRFSVVYTLVRAYASTRDERFAEAFWDLIQAWAEANHPNRGPNWMDGQEAALRLMAWTFGFYAFIDAPSSSPERIAQFTVMVAAHAERIYKNIEYAIATHSNHTISEAFGLWLVGLLFPELQDSGKYSALGRRLLEQEAAAQMFPDGGYSMYSLNYHRFVLHIYCCMVQLAELSGAPASNLIHQRIAASVEYLYQLIDAETGQMPVYGSNDGALVLPLNNCDVTDYRPLLQLGWYLTKKERLFEPGPWDEDVFWLCGGSFFSVPRGGARDAGRTSFPQAGIYLLQGSNSRAFIRCTDFRSRPSHADQLHVDLWWRGRNIACDAGTYLYSGAGIWRNGLAHTWAHNTVIVDHQDQMRLVSRFVWTDWARGTVLQHSPNLWQGQHDGYRRLTDPVDHRRTVLSLGEDRWLVIDSLYGKQVHRYALHWLLEDHTYEQPNDSILLSLDPLKLKLQVGLLEGQAAFSIVRGDPNSARGWRSRYYGEKEPVLSLMLETKADRACFWSYFGFETDSIATANRMLIVRSGAWNTRVDLSELDP